MNLKKYKEEVLFVPLGGAGEIGMNLNLYQQDGKWIIIDMGIGFSNGTVPGVDIIVPDISFLQKIRKDIVAIVLTHGHEDHFGAIQYLYEYLPELPIYATKFTAEFLRYKLKEYEFYNRVDIIEVVTDKKFEIENFQLEFLEINHSIPEMNAVIFYSNSGVIFHTGDWKFDKNPVVGRSDPLDRLAEIGKAGVRALICDSTNVLSQGHSGSEGDLQKSLIEIIKKQKNLVIVSCFASNVARIISILQACIESKRKLVICGRSFARIIEVAKKTGYLKKFPEIITLNQVKPYNRNQIMVLATGCQGEENAALMKFAKGSYPQLKLQKNDSVIFSSKIIPGNEKKIIPLMNVLAQRQVDVITEKDEFVHVSGHPNQDELKQMYELIKPASAIPVHGESFHLHAHVKFAQELGVNSSHYIKNGDCFFIGKKEIEKIGEVESGIMAVDGNSIIKIDHAILKQRKKMAESGVVIISLVAAGTKKISSVKIKAPGIFASREDAEIIKNLEDLVFERFYDLKRFRSKKNKKHLNLDLLTDEIRSVVKNVVFSSLRKKAFIEVIIHEN